MYATQLGLKHIGVDVVVDPPPPIKIRQDSDPLNPRTEWDNVGTMVCWHNRYMLGDGWKEGRQPSKPDHTRLAPHEWLEDFERTEKNSVILPLYLYDHSGITMSTGKFACPWDSGQVGWIYATAERIRAAFSCKRISPKLRAKVEDILKGEVKVYDHWLTNNVWGYVCGDDSCWGFYGDELNATGIADHFPMERRYEVEAAWDARFDR